MPSTTITYRGNPAIASALVQMLEEEGVRVEWTRPEETRIGVAEAVTSVVLALVADGSMEAIKLGIRKFRERFGQTGADAVVEEDDEQSTDEQGRDDG